MSSFTDYTTVSENYDEGRTAVASDVIVSLLRTHTGMCLKVIITELKRAIFIYYIYWPAKERLQSNLFIVL